MTDDLVRRLRGAMTIERDDTGLLDGLMGSALPTIHTPAEVKELFSQKGIAVSERALRAKARVSRLC